jgi:hypothetical protein
VVGQEKQRRNRYRDEWNRTIWEAVRLAGGVTAVAEEFGMNPSSVHFWFTRSYVPSQYIPRLCELGGNRVTADQILAECQVSKLGDGGVQ